mmetsp:Transcript_2005/g.6499  ORF Transcript_2005/g.6499 Transcript_2005/m.6499 type:complete len:565 (-) Transcript_2005:321-2015(-)
MYYEKGKRAPRGRRSKTCRCPAPAWQPRPSPQRFNKMLLGMKYIKPLISTYQRTSGFADVPKARHCCFVPLLAPRSAILRCVRYVCNHCPRNRARWKQFATICIICCVCGVPILPTCGRPRAICTSHHGPRPPEVRQARLRAPEEVRMTHHSRLLLMAVIMSITVVSMPTLAGICLLVVVDKRVHQRRVVLQGHEHLHLLDLLHLLHLLHHLRLVLGAHALLGGHHLHDHLVVVRRLHHQPLHHGEVLNHATHALLTVVRGLQGNHRGKLSVKSSERTLLFRGGHVTLARPAQTTITHLLTARHQAFVGLIAGKVGERQKRFGNVVLLFLDLGLGATSVSGRGTRLPCRGDRGCLDPSGARPPTAGTCLGGFLRGALSRIHADGLEKLPPQPIVVVGEGLRAIDSLELGLKIALRHFLYHLRGVGDRFRLEMLQHSLTALLRVQAVTQQMVLPVVPRPRLHLLDLPLDLRVPCLLGRLVHAGVRGDGRSGASHNVELIGTGFRDLVQVGSGLLHASLLLDRIIGVRIGIQLAGGVQVTISFNVDARLGVGDLVGVLTLALIPVG